MIAIDAGVQRAVTNTQLSAGECDPIVAASNSPSAGGHHEASLPVAAQRVNIVFRVARPRAVVRETGEDDRSKPSSIDSGKATTTAPGGISLAVVGLANPAGEVPAVNNVSGSRAPNISTAFPSIVLAHGKNDVISIASQNFTFGGMCRTSFKLTTPTRGIPTIIAHGASKLYTCNSGGEFIYFFETAALPDDPGNATLTATVTLGSKTISKTVPLIIE